MSILKAARNWNPNPRDKYGRDQKVLLRFLLANCQGKKNSQSIEKILQILENRLEHKYSKESLQHNVLVPLRHQFDFFVGTGSTGIYLIVDGEDALSTIHFYTHRISSERKHLRNLKQISRRHRLFENISYSSKKHKASEVFFDESGTPSLLDEGDQPYFIVTAVVLDAAKRYNLVEEKLNHLRHLLHKPPNYEFKSSNLSKKKHELCLRELGSIEYEFAAVVFVKQKLHGVGFEYPKSFYKFACQFLVEKVLDEAGMVDLRFDQYSSPESTFQTEFENYIRSANLDWPADKIREISSVDSHKSAGGQMADLVAGAVSKTYRQKIDLLPLIDANRIEIYQYPPVWIEQGSA